MSLNVVNPYRFGGASTCVEQLLTGQTAALAGESGGGGYPLGQQVCQQFTSDAWFSLAKITKFQVHIRRAASVDSSLVIKCWLVNQADLDTGSTIPAIAKGQLGGTINAGTDVTESFTFITFEGSGLPDPTVANDMLVLEATGTWSSGDLDVGLSLGTGGAITGTRFCSLSTGTFYPHANRNCTCKINCS